MQKWSIPSSNSSWWLKDQAHSNGLFAPTGLGPREGFSKGTLSGCIHGNDSSTAYAAHYVAEHPDLEIAAIAPLAAASEYGLEVQAKDIQEIEDNYTRFWILGQQASDLKTLSPALQKLDCLDFAK